MISLLKLGAVVGVVGQVDASDNLTRVGVTCAICHSTVDNSFDEGIGGRLDGWPNRDLNVGAIVALSPALAAPRSAVFDASPAGARRFRMTPAITSRPRSTPPTRTRA